MELSSLWILKNVCENTKSILQLNAQLIAVVALLVDKGLITPEEFSDAVCEFKESTPELAKASDFADAWVKVAQLLESDRELDESDKQFIYEHAKSVGMSESEAKAAIDLHNASRALHKLF